MVNNGHDIAISVDAFIYARECVLELVVEAVEPIEQLVVDALLSEIKDTNL
jgi:hypothetical protein